MSIPDVNMTWVGNGPTESGQVVAQRNATGKRILKGYGTATLDGSATTFNLNWIDGTKTLPFTPSAVMLSVSGGDQQASAYVGATVSTISTTAAVVKLSGAGTNAKTLKVVAEVIE